ncbi:hypothetical protein MTO96_049386 [Rhipicephalus appendiculatus]
MLPASARHQDEDGSWIPVSYRRKQQSRATVAPTPSSGSQRKYPHTVILRPKQPCRIMDEQFIRLDRVITRHISAHLDLSEEDQLPEFTVRYLGRSNQLAVDAAEPEVRDGLLAIASLPLSGENVPFPAYEAVSQDQIRGIIRNAGDMTSEELMKSLHCRKCKILQARPLGDKGTAMVTFEGNSLPYKVGLRSFTIRVFPYRARVSVCDICHKIGHHKEQCPNTMAARCSTCGLRQHEEGTHCPNAEPKCRSCGGSHLATATNCPKRREVNKKIEQKRKPAAKRQRKKRAAQGHQRRNPETEQGFPRTILKPTRQSFYTGPPAPPAAQSEVSRRITFADVAAQANAHLTNDGSNGGPHPSCSTLASSLSQPASGAQPKHPRRDAAQSTRLPPPNDYLHFPAPTIVQDIERRLENRMAQIEKSIHEKVEQLISRAIEKCVHTIMERIMLSGMLPLGTASATTSGAHVMRTPLWNCRSFRNKRAEITTRFASKQDNTSPLVIDLQEVNGPVLKIMGYDGYAPSDDLAAPTKTALYVRRGATHVQLDTQPWCSTTLSVVGCRVEVSSQRTLLVFCVYVVPENTRNKANKAPVDLSFISHFKKLYPQDTILLCGDFNSQHVAWGYNQCSPRGRRIMQDASEYRLTLLNTPQTHTRLAQTARQADTSADLTWSTRPQLFRWEVLDDCMGSDHFPILIHFRTGYANTKKPNATTRLSHITHWDKYREFLQQQPPAKNIDHLVSQLCAAKRKATKNLRVPFDHPEPDRHLLTLWNRRLRILAQYRRSGHAAHHKARLRKIQRTIEEYTTTLASDRWMVICESINGQTHTSKVWAILRSLLGQRKTYNGAARVALREGISAQELAEQAAQVFFPQTSHPTDTTYQKDESSEDSEPLNSPFTMLELEHALQHANARSTPGADGVKEVLENRGGTQHSIDGRNVHARHLSLKDNAVFVGFQVQQCVRRARPLRERFPKRRTRRRHCQCLFMASSKRD